MSRSKRGGKPTGWEYWGKRKGGYNVDRKTSHKMERMQFKEEDKRLVEEAIIELGAIVDCSSDPFFKSLFPNATLIQFYNHPDYGENFTLVDGKYYGYLDDIYEMLSYSYHNSVNYKDYDDLRSKYANYLGAGNKRWAFLP